MIISVWKKRADHVERWNYWSVPLIVAWSSKKYESERPYYLYAMVSMAVFFFFFLIQIQIKAVALKMGFFGSDAICKITSN